MGTWPASILRVMGWWNVRDRIPSTSSRMTWRCDQGTLRRCNVRFERWEREGEERRPWRRVGEGFSIEISIIFRFVRINDETRPRLSDYPDWSGLEGSDISINPNACVWNINRSVDRVLSSGGGEGGRSDIGRRNWLESWLFEEMIFSHSVWSKRFQRDDRGVLSNVWNDEITKIRGKVRDRFELGHVCWSPSPSLILILISVYIMEICKRGSESYKYIGQFLVKSRYRSIFARW